MDDGSYGSERNLAFLLLEFFEVEVFPEDVAGFTAVNLETEKAFGGEVFFVGVGKVRAELAVEPGLKTVAVAFDDDGVPAVPLEELLALGSEGGFLFFGGIFGGEEPFAASFVKDAGGPTALWVFEVIVLALVAGDAAIGVLFSGLFVEGPEHAAGVAGLVEELELEGEDEVGEFFFGAEEGVAFDVFAKAANGFVFDFVASVTAGFAPAGEVFAVEEGFEASAFEDRGL